MRRVLAFVLLVLASAAAWRPAVAGSQGPDAPAALVAFRASTDRLVATLAVRDADTPPAMGELSDEPPARFGYRYFDAPAEWREAHAAGMHAGDRWIVHVAPGRVVAAETERIVAGSLGCQYAVGVLLRVVAGSTAAALPASAEYFVAERALTPSPSSPASATTLGAVASPSVGAFRRAVDATLQALLARELPRVRAEAAPEIARMAASSVDYHRSWARDRQTVEAAMRRGEGRLRYDVQSYRLAPDGVPLHFVRAQWFVGAQQGFAASAWLRGGPPGTVVEANVQPAAWLRMFEFQGAVSPEHLGLVLGVFDVDRDGWGEVLVARGGYESMGLSLLEYSPTGFVPTGVEYGYGC